MSANKLRWLIRLLPLLAFFLSIAFENKLISVSIIAVCILAALLLLYCNLDKLTASISSGSPKMKTLKLVTVFDGLLFTAIVIFIILGEAGVINLSEKSEVHLVCGLFTVLILFFGNISPKLPFNRHTGLRLPWTLADEDTWIGAHRLLGYLSLPVAVFNIAGVLIAENLDLKVKISLCAFFLWIIIPSVLSYVFYRRKFRS